MADEKVVEQEVVEPVVPDAVATPEKVEEGAAPAVKPIARTYTQEEVDGIAARVAAREGRKRERELEAIARGRVEQPKVETPVDPVAPKRENFEDYESYIRAEARYVADQRFREHVAAQEEAAKAAKEKEERATAQKAFDQRMTAAATKYPDFQDALETAQGLPITDAMFGAMIRLEEGADLVHYFGTHPAEAHRIAQLHPTVQATEIGKLAAKLPATVSQPASVSKAPEPIEPIGGKTTAVSDNPPSDPEEFKRWHDARERAKRKRA